MSSFNGATNGAAPGAIVVRLDGSDWDIALRRKLARLLEPAATHSDVVLDLSEVRYMDSTCLGSLARMERERQNGNLPVARLVITSENIRQLFKMVGFDQIWPIFDSVEEALKAHA